MSCSVKARLLTSLYSVIYINKQYCAGNIVCVIVRTFIIIVNVEHLSFLNIQQYYMCKNIVSIVTVA